MTGIGERLSSGMEYGNEALFSYTGRGFPKNMDQLKNNVSKNLQSCAKVCSAFLDSSLGMAFSMGVLGLATASVCLQEDLVDVVTTTLLPLEFAALCFKRNDYPRQTEYPELSVDGTNRVYFRQSWTPKTYGVCQKGGYIEEHDFFCVESDEYQGKYPYVSIFQCASNVTSGFLQVLFFETQLGKSIISTKTVCMAQGAYQAMKELA